MKTLRAWLQRLAGTLRPERKDREIAEAEQFYRETALNAAAELLRLLDVPS